MKLLLLLQDCHQLVSTATAATANTSCNNSNNTSSSCSEQGEQDNSCSSNLTTTHHSNNITVNTSRNGVNSLKRRTNMLININRWKPIT